jgi:hypothetical protein
MVKNIYCDYDDVLTVRIGYKLKERFFHHCKENISKYISASERIRQLIEEDIKKYETECKEGRN